MAMLNILLCVAVCCVLGASALPIAASDYIVVFKRGIAAVTMRSHWQLLDLHNERDNTTTAIRHYNINERFIGYHARLSATSLAALEQHEAVDYVEPESVMYSSATCSVQREADWNLVRSATRELKINGLYPYKTNDGEGVDAYIIDTGIYLEHTEFEGRAIWGFDAVDNPSPLTDANGHGTHVAGTVMSKRFGMAKKATAIAVKVLGANGSGSNSGVIAGVDWVAAEYKKRKNPAVANMSLGGGMSKALNDAVTAAIEAGVLFVVAAGNDNRDACKYSPASEFDCITVGSSTNKDERSGFSNLGSCVDIFGPGSDITSTWIGGEYSVNTISGTSMASPAVCGVAARYLSQHPKATAQQVKKALLDSATVDALTKVGDNSPNKLIFMDCEGGGIEE